MSADLYFAVPLLVLDVESAIHEAIHAKVTAYLKTEAARRADFAVPHSDMTEHVRRSFTCILYLNALTNARAARPSSSSSRRTP